MKFGVGQEKEKQWDGVFVPFIKPGRFFTGCYNVLADSHKI